MNAYVVTGEVEGVVYVEVEADNEDAACKQARRLAEMAGGVPNLAYQVVECKERGA